MGRQEDMRHRQDYQAGHVRRMGRGMVSTDSHCRVRGLGRFFREMLSTVVLITP